MLRKWSQDYTLYLDFTRFSTNVLLPVLSIEGYQPHSYVTVPSLRLLEALALSQSPLVLHGLIALKSNCILIQFHTQRSGENSTKNPCLPFTQSHELLLFSPCFVKCFLYFLSLPTTYPFSEPTEGDLSVIVLVTSKYSVCLS